MIRKNGSEKSHINKLCLFLLAFSLIIPITSATYIMPTNKIVNQSQSFDNILIDPLGMPISGDGTIKINSSPSLEVIGNKMVNQSQSFDINILIDPLGMPISGAQLDIAFNGSMFKVNNISEGKFFNQNGATTFFSGGVINNTTGSVKNIFNVIIGNNNVSSNGVFIIVNMTAIGAGGSSWINLSNVKISDPDALPVDVESTNGSIKINSLPSAIDQNGDSLSYSASYLPPGATFNPLTRTFVWVSPLFGTYQNVHFEVSDGILIDSENITLIVSDSNNMSTI